VLVRNLIANFLGQGWATLIQMLLVPVYIHFLGIEAYGLIGVFAVLQAWLVLLDMGLSPTLSREMARFMGGAQDAQFVRDLLRSVEVVALGVAAMIAGGIAAVSGWLSTDWVTVDEIDAGVVAHAFTLMGFVTAMRFIENLYSSSIIGLQRQVTLNLIIAGIATLRGLGSVVVLTGISPTVNAFFRWQAFMSLLSVVTLALIAYRVLPRADHPGRLSLDSLRGVWRFASGMLGVTFLALLLTQVDKILLSRLLSLTDYGFYAVAAVVAGGLYALVSPISQAHQPRLAQLHAAGDDAQFAETFHRSAQLMAVIVGSVAITLIVHSRLIIELWTANSVLAARSSALLSALALGNLLHSTMIIPYQAQLAYGWTRLAFVVNIVAVSIVIPAIIIVTPRYGALGAACIWCSLNLGYVLVSAQLMFKKILLGEKWQWYLDDLLKPLLAAAAVSLTLAWFMPAQMPRLAQLAALLLITGLTLLAATTAAPRVRAPLFTVVLRISTRA
jgi:O-antigen/teichoic acid export membrane protein